MTIKPRQFWAWDQVEVALSQMVGIADAQIEQCVCFAKELSHARVKFLEILRTLGGGQHGPIRLGTVIPPAGRVSAASIHRQGA